MPGPSFQLGDAVRALSEAGSSGLGTSITSQLQAKLAERRRAQQAGTPAAPAEYGDQMISTQVLGLFGSTR